MAVVNYTDRSFNYSISSDDLYILITETSVSSISLLFNGLIIATIGCSSRLHTFSNLLIASLAVSDFIFAVACGIIFISQIYPTYSQLALTTKPAFVCIFAYFIAVTMLCSRIGHFVISVERWLYIAWPFIHLRLITSKSTTWCLITLWVISILSGLHILTNLGNCFTEFILGYSTIDVSTHFVLGGLMLVIYIHIGLIIRRQSVAILKSRAIAQNDSAVSMNKRRVWNMVRMPVTIFGTFFLFTTPIVTTNIYYYNTFAPLQYYQDGIVYGILMIMSMFHTWANFFVYTLQDKEFRSVLKCYFAKIRSTFWSMRVHPSDTCK